jgi:hypothetical protein
MIPKARITLIAAFSLFVFLLLASGALAQSAHSRASAIIDSLPVAKQFDQAVISPDGTSVAYVTDGAITVSSLNNNASHSIEVEGKLPLRSVAWSANSKQLAFLADLTGDAPAAQIWTAPADGGPSVKRAELKGNVDSPSFSPDGSKLAVLFVEGMPRSAGHSNP